MNKVIGTVVTVVVLVFILVHFGNMNKWFGENWLSGTVNNGIKAIRGG